MMKKHIVLSLLVTTSILASNQQIEHLTAEQLQQYYKVDKIITQNRKSLDRVTISGSQLPPLSVKRHVVNPNLAATSSQTNESADINSVTSHAIANLETPAFTWSFGCSATSGAMLAGYYDRHGYPYVYNGPTNEGRIPLDNSIWSDWVDAGGNTRHQTPLSATHKGLDGRTQRGHVDDYWIEYGNNDDDPFITNNWVEHTYNDCTADFMKTNQTTKYGNSDGATTFYFYNSGAPLTAAEMEGYDIEDQDGAYGLKLFFESRGYKVAALYSQKIDTNESGGFSFNQYKAEINTGHPVLIHVTGHTMIGVGYEDTNNTIYLHDTWDYKTHTMSWGNSYSGMTQFGVSVIHLVPNIVPKDFNKDGIPDILFRNKSLGKNLIFFLYETGLRASYAYTTKISSLWNAEGLGDFNADGITDILFRNDTNGKNLIYFQQADGSRASYAYTSSISPEWEVAAIADFNSDSVADIFFRNKDTGENLIFFQQVDGSRAASVKTNRIGTDWKVVATADFDNDGDIDIFYRNTKNGKNLISFQNIDGSRASYTYLNKISIDWKVAGVGDFNKDGVVDILYRNTKNGKNLISFQNTDGTRASYTYTTSVSPNWKVATVADYNGDQIADIFYRNTKNGKNFISFQNADGSRASYKYTTPLSTSWKVVQ